VKQLTPTLWPSLRQNSAVA